MVTPNTLLTIQAPVRRPFKRPTNFSESHVGMIADAIRDGNTKKAAANAAGFSYEWFRSRMEAGALDANESLDTLNAHLFLAVEKALADCQMSRQAALKKAADGYETKLVKQTVKTEYRTYKVKDKDGSTVEKVISTLETRPDGTTREIPVEFTSTTTETVCGAEFDWRAALEWLKRYYPEEWGDRQDITSDGKQLPGGNVDPAVLASAIAKLREAGVPISDSVGDGT